STSLCVEFNQRAERLGDFATAPAEPGNLVDRRFGREPLSLDKIRRHDRDRPSQAVMAVDDYVAVRFDQGLQSSYSLGEGLTSGVPRRECPKPDGERKAVRIGREVEFAPGQAEHGAKAGVLEEFVVTSGFPVRDRDLGTDRGELAWVLHGIRP